MSDVVGLENHRLTAAEGEVETVVVELGGGDVAVEGIKPVGVLEGDGERLDGLDVVGGEVGDEVVVARGVAAADGLQAAVRLHRFGTGGGAEGGGVGVMEDVGTLGFQLGDMGFDRFGHLAGAGDDEAAVASAGLGDELSVLTGDAHQQALGDVVAVEAGAVDGEDGLNELRGELTHGVDGELHQQLPGVLLPHIANGQ